MGAARLGFCMLVLRFDASSFVPSLRGAGCNDWLLGLLVDGSPWLVCFTGTLTSPLDLAGEVTLVLDLMEPFFSSSWS